MRAVKYPTWLAVATVVIAGPVLAIAQSPVGTAFTYQGQLKEAGTPYDGSALCEFSLWDDPNSTNPNDLVAGPIELAVIADNGLFTAQLDFGENVFTGEARWLEVAVFGGNLNPIWHCFNFHPGTGSAHRPGLSARIIPLPVDGFVIWSAAISAEVEVV